jgi:class 3 adenylate cyclase/tetratricopeptide (TPR) repeat protein
MPADFGGLRYWLATLGLEAHADAFIQHQVDLEALPYLSDADLSGMGLALGPRRIIQVAIARRNADEAQSAISDRRQLTVLFCDLVGSTALSARLDPEEMHGVIRAYYSACCRIIEDNGGFIARLVGDGILAYFGYPLAREDAAECAARAGLLVVQSFERDRLRPGSPLDVRIGIATGLAIVSDIVGVGFSDLHSAVGQTPNTAARIQSLAPPGGVLVSQETRRLAGEFFAWHDEGLTALKGIEGPVRLWRVLGETHAPARFDGLRRASTFVGRDPELGLLLQLWATARQAGCQVVTLVGEGGIGKSRLLRAAAEATCGMGGGQVMLQGSPSQQASPLYPVMQWLRWQAALTDDAQEDWARLVRLLGEDAGPDDLQLLAELTNVPVPSAAARPALPSDRKRERMREIVARLLERRCGEAGCLLMVEDAHWIDGASRNFLLSLVERMASRPLLVVVTTRPAPERQWSVGSRLHEIVLGPLADDDARRLLWRVFGEREVPSTVTDAILAKTDGVPLFIEELGATVLESGLLRERGGALVFEGPEVALDIPSTLQDSLLARLDRLNDIKEVALVASALGREFSFGLLEQVLGYPSSRLKAALDRLVEAQLLFQRGSATHADYVFKHALVQQAAYQCQLRSDRQALHKRIVHTIERSQPDFARREPGLMAHHCQQAGLADAEVDYLLAAGRLSTRLVAIAEALAWFERAVEVLGRLEPSPRNVRCEIEAITGMMDVGRFAIMPARLRALSGRARELAHTEFAVVDLETFAAILFQDGRAKVYTSRYGEARETFQEIVQLGVAHKSRTIERKPASAFAMGLCCQGLFAEMLAFLDEDSIDYYKAAGSFIDYIAGLGWLGYARCQTGGDAGLRWGNQSVHEANAVRAPIYVAGAHIWRSHAFMAVRRHEEAIADALNCVRVNETQAIPYLSWHGYVFLALCQCRGGDPDGAEESLAQARKQLALADGCWSLLDYVPAIEAELALVRGRLDECVGHADSALAIASRADGHFTKGMAWRAKALACLLLGRPLDEAEALFALAMGQHTRGVARAESAFSAQVWSQALRHRGEDVASAHWARAAQAIAGQYGFDLARCEFSGTTFS